jgi:hypothetical protein
MYILPYNGPLSMQTAFQLHISLANSSCGTLDPRFSICTQDNRQVEWLLFVGGVEWEITCQEIREGSNASDSENP